MAELWSDFWWVAVLFSLLILGGGLRWKRSNSASSNDHRGNIDE
jgi:hypothetical protein